MASDKKKAAAIAAVMNYIKSEEEMVAAQATAGTGVGQQVAGPVSTNLWGMSGRQAMMQMRNLMQMRSFHGTKVH
jgi:hypothetical protein